MLLLVVMVLLFALFVPDGGDHPIDNKNTVVKIVSMVDVGCFRSCDIDQIVSTKNIN